MGRTALYRDAMPFSPPRARVELEPDVLVLEMPDGRTRRHALDGVAATVCDGCVRNPARIQRRFVRMLVLERDGRNDVIVTPPEQGAVAPNVVRVPEAPTDSAIVETRAWEALAEWIVGGGRLGACSIADLARLACIATPQFALLIGEVAAQRAIEQVAAASGPLRGGSELEPLLQPLARAARHSPRATEALISALAHVAGASRRRRR